MMQMVMTVIIATMTMIRVDDDCLQGGNIKKIKGSRKTSGLTACIYQMMMSCIELGGDVRWIVLMHVSVCFDVWVLYDYFLVT